MNREEDAGHARAPRHAEDDGGFLDFRGDLHHAVHAAAGSERQELDGGHQHQHAEGAVEEFEIRGCGDGEVNGRERHRGHEIREEREAFHDAGEPAAAAAHAGIADEHAAGADNRGDDQRQKHLTQQRAPHRRVEQDAGDHAGFIGRILRADPEVERHVARAVIAGLTDDRFQREGDQRHDGEERREDDQQYADGPVGLVQLDQRNLAALAGDGGEGFALAGEALVDAQNQAAQQDGDKRDDVALPLIARLNQRAHLGGERVALDRRAEEHRYGVGAEAAGEDQQEGREDGGHDDRDGHAADDRRAAGLEDRRAFLERRVHVFEDAADEQVRERGIMQPRDDNHREQAVDEPLRHAYAEDGFHHADVAAADPAVLEHVRPEQGERPRGHHVGEDEDRRDELFALEVGSRDEPRDRAAHRDAQNARAERDDQRIAERLPEVDLTPIVPGEELLEMPERGGADRQAQQLLFRADVHGEHVAQHRRHRQQAEQHQHDQKEDKQQVGRFGDERPKPVAPGLVP